jgi:pimeloyl-ACP methyl ester carboxylesterase
MPEAMIAVTRKRRNQWASADEMFERFASRSPFSRWRPAALRDYCDYGVEQEGAGGYRLACSPETEAGIYATSSLPENGVIYADVAALEIPARVVRCGIARHGAEGAEMMLSSPTASDLASHFKHSEDVVLADTSHFIPMEAPERVAALIASWPPA